jgi:hypothetical protein
MLSRKFVILLLIIFLFSVWLQGCVLSGQSQTTEKFPSISNSASIISNPSPSRSPKPPPSITLNETLPTSSSLNPPNTGIDSGPRIAPANGTRDVSLTPILVWGTISPTETGFDLKLATDPNFDHILDSQTNTPHSFYQVTMVLKPNTTYYWAVRARNATAVGDWIIRAFTTAQTPSITSGNLSNPSIFGFKKVVWNSFAIYLRGTTILKDSSQLESELYKDGRLVDWWSFWPKITIVDGVWLKMLKARSTQESDRLPEFGTGYSVKIWGQNKPDVAAVFNLPFQGQNNSPTTDLKNTRWKLILLNDKSLSSNMNFTAGFDINGAGTIWGNTNGNIYGGKYESCAPDNLIIYGIDSTTLGSSTSNEQLEITYLSCLFTAFTYKVSDNHLEIYDNQQIKTLVFEKVP